MRNLTIILMAIFVITGLVFVYLDWKQLNKHKNILAKDKSQSVQEMLICLDKETDALRIANLFVGLLSSSYILVHIMTNEGNKYDDKIQSKSFKKSLNGELIQKLLMVEGRYE